MLPSLRLNISPDSFGTFEDDVPFPLWWDRLGLGACSSCLLEEASL